jgi:hypothetical protein
MKRTSILMVLIFCLSLVLASCGGSEAPKATPKKGDRSGSDWSASGQVKEIEEMQKAAQRGAPATEQPKPATEPAAPKK